MRLPYNPVIDFSPPPVVMIATTGTCRAEGGWDVLADSIQHCSPHCNGVWSPQTAQVLISEPRSIFRRKDSKTHQQLLLPLISLWINMGSEINPNLDSCPSLRQIQAQMNKNKPSVEATMYYLCNNILSLTPPLLFHTLTTSV